VGFGDYGVVHQIRVLLALLWTGGRKLDHVRYIASDPLVSRFCGLTRLPKDRSISNWLKEFRQDSLRSLIDFNAEVVLEQLHGLNLPRITLELDGTAISCGKNVAWAARGYNPHQRYAKSYYPLLCHVGQTGHFLRVHNRPGNVHDSKGGALSILRESVERVRTTLGSAMPIEVRLDSAFFTEAIVGSLLRRRLEFVIKVPVWEKAGFKAMIQERKRWKRAGDRLWYFTREVQLNKWGFPVQLTFYRRKISDHPPKTYQYDLFSPDDGVYEYFILASNKSVHPKTLFRFYNGRCAMEGQIAELKGECAFDTVPTNHYGANSAYQQISLLAYNLMRNFQLDTKLAKPREITLQRTGRFSFQSLKSIRFKLIAVAGRMIKREYGNVLRINANPALEQLYKEIEPNILLKKAA
jgi:hypothetical protein